MSFRKSTSTYNYFKFGTDGQSIGNEVVSILIFKDESWYIVIMKELPSIELDRVFVQLVDKPCCVILLS